jgi:hypothetical protein
MADLYKTISIPFLINKDNQEFLLNGKKIVNIDNIPSLISEMMNIYKPLYVYEVRSLNSKINSQYPDPSFDNIIGEVVGISDIYSIPKLTIAIANSLLYSKYSNNDPVIRINGFMEHDENDNIIISEITRLTIGPSDLVHNVYSL